MPWGGRQLADWVPGPFPEQSPIGEVWLLSDHALHASRVAEGPLRGATLRELMSGRGGEVLTSASPRFPLLLKLLDARENLSIQVHPDDAAAAKLAASEGGKTEAWLVLDADAGSAIHLGLKPGIDRATVLRELSRGTLPLCLQRHDPKPGDCYFVPAGAVHALGGGVVVLEVQQTSDATFRLHDWGRVDAEGKPRALHIEAGLACLKESPAGVGLQSPVRIDRTTERLATCEYFHLHRVTLTEPIEVAGLCILVGLEGEAAVEHEVHSTVMKRGRTILIPANVSSVRIVPDRRCVLARVDFP
jgi:mannose-6-phosphate isomerase